MKLKQVLFLLAVSLCSTGCVQNDSDNTLQSLDSSASNPSETQVKGTISETLVETKTSSLQETIESSMTETDLIKKSVSVGNRLYQVFGGVKTDEVKMHCQYGTLRHDRYKAGDYAEVYGKKIDFSSVPFNPEITANIVYCVPENQSVIYFLYYKDFYRSDPDLKSPELLFNLFDVCKTGLIIDVLMSFPNTELLFFHGFYDTGVPCVGSINPDTKEIRHTFCNASEIVQCNSGVMLYDVDALSEHRQSSVVYWERGEICRIPLQNPRESENLGRVSISANGKYLCTVMSGLTKDHALTERCTVYDVGRRTFIRSFDWTFSSYDVNYPSQRFQYVGFDENQNCLFVKDGQTPHDIYRFDFGE